MSPRPQKRVSVPKARSKDYRKVAENFYQGAEMAQGFEYWNAAGVLIVHAAIAYTDAITIRRGGVKSKGEDHAAAADLLRGIIPVDEAAQKALRQLERMIHEKNRVSYEGHVYTRKDIGNLWKSLERYRAWARSVLDD
ncbi:MAG: hypothetical protein ABIJ96_03920 [Elusimicrobiota bacterium]